MVFIHMETNHVVGLPGRSGDPSPYTARGVFKSMQGALKHLYDDACMKGKVVAVQGVGNVGYYLCELLFEAGAKLIVSDVNADKVGKVVEDFGATAVGLDDIYDAECDIYAPCALGATINDDTIPRLKCKIICGGANNVLKDAAKHGQAVFERGIVYCPDYLANAGGVINVSNERGEFGYNEESVLRDVDYIYVRMYDILNISKETGKLPGEVADKLAEERVEAIRLINSIRK
jgi:leucine dehydrogenase